MSTQTYLITGASRGIGKGFVASLLSRPTTTVIAAVRNPSKFSAELNAFPVASGSKLIIVKLDSAVDADAATAISTLQSEHGITSIDVIIANAGISHSGSSIIEQDPKTIREHFDINAVAPVLLLRAAKPLLQASKSGRPTFVAISTAIGSIDHQENLMQFGNLMAAYGPSKAALNWFIHRADLEESWLTAFMFHPGLVATDMAATALGGADPMSFGAITVETSVEGMLKEIGGASKEKTGGKFLNYDGSALPW
ncbi:Short chain dehydrogenase-like protein 56 [Elsinoe fawcettii]|nr:Short chain dehydrogenase-like protein 56 [Elsinoe fawcettii]